MDWIQVLTIAGLTIGTCWFMHRETSKEIKDLHGRLCTLVPQEIFRLAGIQ
jgi:hypothetical protein